MNSRYYYSKNKGKLEHEKALRRKIREKREREEAERLQQNHESQKQTLELNKFYSKEYVLDNSFYLTLDWGSSFLIQVKFGDRKLE